MTLDILARERTDLVDRRAARRWRQVARPALGALLPLAIAVAWEWLVRSGWSNGRLVPPPSRIFEVIQELARSGELLRHVTATLTRVAAGFGLGVGAARCSARYRVIGAQRGGCSILRCRRSVRFPRSPGCRCSFYE